MANFAYLPNRGSLAAWATGSLVTSNEFWFFESSIVKCPNFADGGTYAPTSPIVIGGSGIVMAGTLECDGAAVLNGNVTLGFATSNTLSVFATSTFAAPVTFSDNVTIAPAGNFVANGYVGLNGNTDIGNSSANYCNISATTQINAPLTASGMLYPTGTIRAPLTFGTGGYIKRRILRPTINPGSDKSASVDACDQVLMAVVADVVIEDNGEDGAMIHVASQVTGTINIKNASGVVLVTMTSPGNRASFVRLASVEPRWHMV